MLWCLLCVYSREQLTGLGTLLNIKSFDTSSEVMSVLRDHDCKYKDNIRCSLGLGKWIRAVVSGGS